MKEKIFLGVGIMAIIAVAALIIMGSNQCYDDQSVAAEATTDMLLQQKDVAIAKLAKQIKTKDAALVTAKAQLVTAKAQLGTIESKLAPITAELEGAKKKIDTIKEEASAPIEIQTPPKK